MVLSLKCFVLCLFLLIPGVGFADMYEPLSSNRYDSSFEPMSQEPLSEESRFLPVFEAQGLYWMTDFSGSMQMTEAGLIGTSLDFEDDLGIADEDVTDIRLMWHITPAVKIRLAYVQLNYEGNTTLQKTISFSGQTYTIGTAVTSSLDTQYIRLGGYFDLLSFADGMVRVGGIVDAKVFMIDAAVKAPALTLDESEEVIAGLPTLGGTVSIHLQDIVELFFEASGMGIQDGYLYDCEAGIKIRPYQHVEIVGGYRIFELDVEQDNDSGNLKIAGPFVGATIRF